MPYRDILTPLMQRLVRLVGAPIAVSFARKIPNLIVDDEGNILDYDRENPANTARLLLEQCENALGDVATSLRQQALRDSIHHDQAGFPPQIDLTPAAPIKVLIVDDHVLVREGLVNLIDPQPDLQVVGEAGSVAEAITLANSTRPDLILMDFTLPDGTGDTAAREILAALPNTKIVFLTVHEDDQRLFAAISVGAAGYLLKSVRSADLLNRLRAVMRNEVALSPGIGPRILEEFARLPALRPSSPSAIDELTEREVQILRLIVEGHTNRQIGEALNLSVRTVEYHRANVTSKLGLHSRAQLVRYATERGLLDPPQPYQKSRIENHKQH
jgi:DNA-binding NarL/FixJ family response regulator